MNSNSSSSVVEEGREGVAVVDSESELHGPQPTCHNGQCQFCIINI